MAQVSYGTITITDTNDINRIYVEYCRSTSNQLSGTTVPDITRAWGETTPEWVDGQYIWQRTVIEKSGTLAKTYGTPVCLTGAQGETGEQGPQGPQGGTGAAGRSLTSTTTQYTTAATSATITQSNMGSYTWSDNVPDYNASTPAYWVRITNVYSNPSSTQYIIYKDNGITDAVKTSHDANSTAASANSTANAANQTANTANTTANNANTKADQAVTNVNNLQTRLSHYWINQTSHTNGNNGWIKPDYPVGTYAASGIDGTTFDEENSSTYGYNTWYANGINLRYNAINLGQLTGTSLTFYQPSTTTQGAKAMELTGSALKFYASDGSTIQAEFGGSKARVSGTINAYDGQIGNSEDNYWYIGNYLDYFENQSAIIKSHGTASIQLGDTNTWRIATNRIHTAWNNDSDSGEAFRLHFPVYDNKYWDSGLHLPTSATDKLLYIRNSSSSNTLTYLNEALEDQYTNRWNYLFYITNSGSLYAKNIYVLDDNGQATQIGGTDGVYLLKSGGTITGDLTVNGTITGTLSGTASNANTVNNLTVQTAVPANAVFTDTKVTQTASTGNSAYELLFSSTADNTTRTEGARKTSTLTYNPSTKALLTGGTINGYTLAAASAKGVDTSLTASSTSTNLPTSAAVTNLIKQYLPLTGGNVTGTVSFGSSVSADELTVGDLVVNGAASFTNNLQANTINGVTVGSNPKFTDTTYTFTNGTNGFTVTPLGGTAQTVTVTPSIANNVTGSGTSGYLAKFTGTNTIGNGPALGSDTTKFLNNKGEWAVPTGTYTYTLPLAASGTRGGVQIGYTTSGKNYAVQLSSEKMYVNVPWTDTWNAMTGATSSANGTVGYIGTAPPKDGYNTKYWRADGTWTVPPNDNTHRPIQLDSTEILGNNTTALNLVTGGGIALSNSSGAVTIAHKDTSSQNSSSNSGRTYIQSITLDTYGHVTGLSTATETVTNTHYTTHLYVGKSNSTGNAATTATDDTYLRLFDDTTARESHKIAGSGATTITSDSSGHITINSPIALTNVSFADGTITFTKSDGNTIPITTDNFVITQASGATALVKLKSGSTTEYEGYSAGGATTAPVYFDTNGHPVAVTSIPWSLIAGEPSTYTPSTHTHGNLSNDGKITSTATIASGDKLVIVDSDSTAGSKITGSSITFGTSTTTFLSNKGTWETPSAAGSATNATYATYDASEANNTTKTAIADKYIPKSIGTAAGDIIYWSASGTPVRLAKGTNGQVLKLANGVPTWGTDNNDNTTYTIATGDSNGQIKVTPSSGNAYNVSVKGLGSNAYTSTAYLPLAGGTMTGGVTFVGNQSSAWNDKGIIFTQGSRIGENTSGGLGIYATEHIYLRPNSGTASSGDGVEITDSGLYPTNNNSETLGTSSNKWSNVYATTFTGNLTGTASGNVTSVQYDSTNTKFTYTKNGTNTDIVTIANLKTYLGLGAAAYKGVTDNSTATAVTSTDTNLITARTLYNAGYVKSSGVTSVATGTGLTGGPITSTGTVSLATVSRTNNTSTASPAHSGTFTAIDSITTDSYGRVTAVNTKTVTLPASGNTDQNVNQSATTTANWRKILLSYQNDSSATAAVASNTNVVYGAVGISAQPSTGYLRAGGYNVLDKVMMKYDATLDALVFSFA